MIGSNKLAINNNLTNIYNNNKLPYVKRMQVEVGWLVLKT